MNFRFILFFSITAILLNIPCFGADPIVMGRYPAPSPDGNTLAFSYAGDLWTVPIDGGWGTRITVHEAYDKFPIWSPDGQEIAFSSNRNGNDDIFVMDVRGGQPEQLTHFSNSDYVCDWWPDGRGLIFASWRNFVYHRLPVLWQVDRDGGTPIKVVSEYMDEGKVSPDNEWLAFVRGRDRWWRKNYRGSGQMDVWLYNFKTKRYRQLTNHNGYDHWPMWGSDSRTIYYVSDETGTFNIWQTDIDGSSKRQMTYHKEDGVRFSSISRNGSVIAYEQSADIWTLKTGEHDPRKVEIFAASDQKANPIERTTFSSKATEMEVSHDEKEAAFVIRGEIFVTKMDEDESTKAMRITDNPARDYDIGWAPHGDTLAFVSDRNGNRDIYLAYSTDPDEKRLSKSLNRDVVQLTDSKEEDHGPRFSPDGKKIAFIRGNGEMWTMNRDGSGEKRILEGWAEPTFTWSPDSKWITFSRDDEEFNQDVFIMPADGGAPVNITQHPDNDFGPVWSEDGRKLGFISRRLGDTEDAWFVFLQRKDDEMTKEEWEDEEENEKEDDEEENGEKKKEVKIEVRIDFEDIHKRLRRITSLPGEEGQLAVSTDGKMFAFSSNNEGKNDLWVVEWDGEDLKQLTDGGVDPLYIKWDAEGKKIYYMKSGGTFHSISKDGEDGKGYAYAARLVIDHQAERLQMFDEGWRILNDSFYDPKFHGADWGAIKEKYRPMAARVQSQEDFYDVVRLMIGELNASHLGIYGPDPEVSITTGLLGLTYDESYTGNGLRIETVLPRGPCDHEGRRLEPGEVILAVDGIPLEGNTNLYEQLIDKVGEKVQVDVKGKDGQERRVVVRPINYGEYMNKEYDRWVKEKQDWVDKESDGKIGYLHIRGMGVPSLERFEMELYSVAHGKEGLVVDVRNNGGGWTTDYLLAILSPKPHAITVPRGGREGYPQSRRPLYAWSKPMVAMCNQYSYSNAEIFSHAVKTLERGKLVGMTTPGEVISTGGTTLIDGSWFRIPFRGWYVKGNIANMEKVGAVPDYIVEVQPGDVAEGMDRQLEKAVEVLMGELE
ncbi:MAG: PD40 domain-containing protein [Gemmatimonadota bacterium]|nr:MAG: PD40 domain-containing protein [Gemmatimonadota bacterium]